MPMRSLREVQRGFTAAALFDDTAAIAALGIVAGTLDAAARIAVYRNNVLGNYRRALAATYPVVRRLVGGTFFNAAIDAFVRAHPSRHGDVNRYGGELARFLAAHPPPRVPAYLPDVARLEWAIDQANITADAPALDLVALAAVPVDAHGELIFKLHPSAQIVTSQFPVFRLWQVNQPGYEGDERVDLDEGGDALLVRRAPDGVTIERLAPGEHAFLAALARNNRLHRAEKRGSDAEASFDLAAVLKRHVAACTIVSFRVPTTPSPGVRP
jgi:hypothetical protein